MSSRCSPAPCAKPRAASAAMRPSFVAMSPVHGRTLRRLHGQSQHFEERLTELCTYSAGKLSVRALLEHGVVT